MANDLRDIIIDEIDERIQLAEGIDNREEAYALLSIREWLTELFEKEAK